MLPMRAEVPTEPIHRLSVAQYRGMLDAGILKSGDPVELLEGWLVQKMTKNPPHRIATRRVRVALEALAASGWYVDAQEPIVTADSEPEPDVAVIRGRTEDYAATNPPASVVGLVVEVADISLLRDRDVKARVYARSGIAVYWLLNLVERKLEVFQAPDASAEPPRYGEHAEYRAGQTVPVVLDGVVAGVVAVADLLP